MLVSPFATEDPWTTILNQTPSGAPRTHDGDVLAPRTEQRARRAAAAARGGRPRPVCAAQPVRAPGLGARAAVSSTGSSGSIGAAFRWTVDINTRPTERVLGGYYRSRRLVRVYSHDRVEGRRPLEELFDTFLHEVAHHLEYTEPVHVRRASVPARPRADAQPPVLANPGRAQVALGRAASPAPASDAQMSSRRRAPVKRLVHAHSATSPSSFSLAATSAPACRT